MFHTLYMNTNILGFVLENLEASRGSWPKIAKETDIPYFTIQKIAQRYTENPGVLTVQKLADYFKSKEL